MYVCLYNAYLYTLYVHIVIVHRETFVFYSNFSFVTMAMTTATTITTKKPSGVNVFYGVRIQSIQEAIKTNEKYTQSSSASLFFFAAAVIFRVRTHILHANLLYIHSIYAAFPFFIFVVLSFPDHHVE